MKTALNRNNKKLKFYSIFKNDCLNIITNINHKKTLNKDRLGNHRLQIETGRHTVPKTPENLRICPFCHLNEIEHELHFLFNCNLYNSLHTDLTFAETWVIDTPLLIILTTIKKIFFIFNNVDPHIYRLTAAYIHLCMEYRQKLVLYLRFISNVGNTTYSRGNTECCSPLKLYNSTAMIFKLYLICS